ncbi:hypothetical protein OOJ91_34015 [Micromonospora lupini]|uniref:hypothetical protein n=1 Tax=Micromonospora lupini TaxID=285679 RepID=UPI00224CADD6|nr:hypothetical protein [Micromonospora lupini]MCX5070865.1 hypothetical protein [Micromonospora lupini]
MSLANPQPTPLTSPLKRWLYTTTSWRSGFEAVSIGAIMAAVAIGSRTDTTFYRTALIYAAFAVALGLVVLAGAAALTLLKRRTPAFSLSNPATPQQLRDFHRIIERVREMPEHQRAALNALVERSTTDVMADARETAYQAAVRSGRVNPHDYKRPGLTWGLLEELHETCEGAYAVALAVLVDDLLTDAEYTLLTVPWIAAGEQIYAPASVTAITSTPQSS